MIGGAVALLVAFATTPLFAALARRLRLLDFPAGRKDHAAPTPFLGGAAILLAFLLGLLAAGGLGGEDLAILGGTGLAFAVGLTDDAAKGRFPAAAKLAGQAAAAILAVASGLRGGWSSSAPLDAALTFLLLLAATNAFNFLDNMDGLVAGLGVVAAATLALLGDSFPAEALLGACLGFLPWNFPRARAFAGDAGSHAIGFAATAIAVRACSRAEGSLPARALPLLAIAVPILDLVRVVLLRLRLRRPPHVGDHLHLSHRVAATGLGRGRAVLLLWLLAVAGGAAAVVTSRRGALAALLAEGGVLLAFLALARRAAYQRTTFADS
ncbi:MAG: undecaprenyl/decaprenyl-phosphate alpha-N-acetylglucosaminyl 1-phosphate transferase [Planctomycetes bacterium]|nr:undecaprenyl/decaprenyl-phosphate alpha-N-acetylglucosaminyl 1-phosphate transferase [Planctomycetota bacterium]